MFAINRLILFDIFWLRIRRFLTNFRRKVPIQGRCMMCGQQIDRLHERNARGRYLSDLTGSIRLRVVVVSVYIAGAPSGGICYRKCLWMLVFYIRCCHRRRAATTRYARRSDAVIGPLAAVRILKYFRGTLGVNAATGLLHGAGPLSLCVCDALCWTNLSDR